jgi:hypothetical protein
VENKNSTWVTEHYIHNCIHMAENENTIAKIQIYVLKSAAGILYKQTIMRFLEDWSSVQRKVNVTAIYMYIKQCVTCLSHLYIPRQLHILQPNLAR